MARIVEYAIARGIHANRNGPGGGTRDAGVTARAAGGGGSAPASDRNTQPEVGEDVTSAGTPNDGFARFGLRGGD